MNYFDLGEILSTTDHFKSLSKPHKIRLIKLVNKVLCGDFQHKELIPTKEIGSVSLHSVELKKWFRKKSDNGYYKKVINPYFDCVNQSYSFGNGKGKTKKYRLKKWVENLCNEYYKTDKSIQFSKVSNDDITPITTIPFNGVSPKDINGLSVKSNVFVKPIVYPNEKLIDETLKFLENIKPNEIRRNRIYKYSIHNLSRWKSNLKNNLCDGGVIQLYQEGENGRLNPHGGIDVPHIINTSSGVRTILFGDMNLWLYDMSNSHLSLFYGLCEKYGIRCPNIGEYLEKKVELRKKWSNKFYIKEEVIKEYIISWLYGNHPNPIKVNPYYQVMGYDRLTEIKNDGFLMEMYKEIIQGRKLIVENYKSEDGTITNIVGKTKQSYRLKSDLCFILFGYESKVLELVNEVVGRDMICMIYDGWIGRRTTIKNLEYHVKQNLGFEVKFDGEPIKPNLGKLY